MSDHLVPAALVPMAVGVTGILWDTLALLVLFVALSIVVLSLVWLERKVLGRLQRRLGPTRTGPMGLLQPVADAVKLILKEDILPASAERSMFWLAPVIVVVPAFMIWVTIPAAQNAVVKNLDLGLLYITAFSVVGILGLVMAGWGSANKYATLGGLRAAAQLISYEIPVIMVVIGVAMLAQSLDLREIVGKPAAGALRGDSAPGACDLLHCRPGRSWPNPVRYLLCRVRDCRWPLCGV